MSKFKRQVKHTLLTNTTKDKATDFMSKNYNVRNDKSAVLIMHCVMMLVSATIGITDRRLLEKFSRLIPVVNSSLSKLLIQQVIPKFNTASLKH
jgi:hypothetical protein